MERREQSVPGRSVRNIAAHLLHDDLRRLSRTRDHVGGSAPDSNLDELEGAAGRVSKQHLSGWMWRATTARTRRITSRSARRQVAKTRLV